MTRAAPALTWTNGRFLRHGEPHRILAGSVHYFRVHPRQWRDRLQRLADMGLNTVDTYIAWNFHQPAPDAEPSFAGWRDVSGFLEAAADVGLDAIVRPGPYICAEWDNGALPAWFTAGHPALRTSDPRFLDPVAHWFDALLPILTPLQASRGGPIVAMQVENEFGSFGDDPAYVPAMRDLLRDRDVVELLYTADGPTELMLDAGAVDGALIALNLGSQVAEAREAARGRRPDEPFLCGEFWNGWFDHWGHPHHVRDAAGAADTLAEILDDGGSVSLYMAHGGTNFGTWAGANRVGDELRPTTTSYDSDAPIAEDGTLTPKFHAFRDALGASDPIVSEPPRLLAPRTLPVTVGGGLTAALDAIAGAGRTAWNTGSFEDLGFPGTLMRYDADAALPDGAVTLGFESIGDRAIVLLDGERIGTVRERGEIEVRGSGRHSRLTVIVENLGRVNYGHRLGEQKGLVGPVLVDRRMVQEWTATPLPFADDTAARISAVGAESDDRAGVAIARFDVDEPSDTHLALPGFGKGFVWVNGFLLGRHWEIGPQRTLYVPAPLVRSGANEIVVLDLEHRGASIELRDRPDLGPEEPYIESF